MKKGTACFSLIFIALLTAAYLLSRAYLVEKITPEQVQNSNTHPIVALSLSMSRELRQVIASYAWLRIDEYFHSTAILLRKNKEIIPLLKLVTIFDPTFTDASLILAHHLSYHLEKHAEAISVLRESISKNTSPPAPKLAELYFEAGWIATTALHDTKEAIIYLREGKKYVTDKCDFDNSNLAIKLLSYLEKNAAGGAYIKIAPKIYDDAGNFKELMEHDDDDGGGDPAHRDDDEHQPHIFAGQNPWKNPEMIRNLKISSAAYSIFFLIFLVLNYAAARFKKMAAAR